MQNIVTTATIQTIIGITPVKLIVARTGRNVETLKAVMADLAEKIICNTEPAAAGVVLDNICCQSAVVHDQKIVARKSIH
ncbi:MAG: hypothetical protein CSA70_11730 [Rhodobacterales bacterium]|nr:MAG: hypothetical protein CR984_01310 [Pseudomonadota bacterium]PIE10674.1 MAG: hypothetical protein CSA70_11730 [Rhodobacterales bacterium]